jgi:hypothetical protein
MSAKGISEQAWEMACSMPSGECHLKRHRAVATALMKHRQSMQAAQPGMG